MTEKTYSGINQEAELQSQLNQAFKELDEIRNTRQSITDPDSLEAAERDIFSRRILPLRLSSMDFCTHLKTFFSKRDCFS